MTWLTIALGISIAVLILWGMSGGWVHQPDYHDLGAGVRTTDLFGELTDVGADVEIRTS